MKIAITIQNMQKNISKFIRRFSIRKRLLIIYLVQVCIMALWCSFIVNGFFNDYSTYIDTNNIKLVNVVTENMRSTITALKSITKYPVLRTDARPTKTYEYLSNPSVYSQHDLYADLDSKSSLLFSQHTAVRLIAVFDLEGNGSFIQNGEKFVYNANTTDKLFINKQQAQRSWFDDTLSGVGDSLIWSMKDLKRSIIPINEEWILVSRAIFNTEKFENIGVILAAADVDDSLNELDKNKMFPEQRLGFFDNTGTLLAGDINKNIFNQVYHKALSLSETDSKGSFIQKVHAQKNIYTFSTSFDGYFCVLETPYKLVIANTLRQQVGLLIFIALSFLSITLSSGLIVKSISNPLKKLTKACENVRSGDFGVHIQDNGNDELSDFTSSFNSMTLEINRLIHEVYEKNIALTQTELQMLRSQINPHFVYNILETIRATALMNDEMELSEMAFLLANTLRYGISQPSELVSVKKEIDMLDAYIRLQKLLYKDEIQFIKYLEPQMLEYSMPKLLLQPLVENALFHGVNPIDGKRIVTLLGFVEDGDIIFKVTDNGIGMDSRKLKNLRGYINNENNLFEGIGLKNIHRRIRLYYGKKYGIIIDSSLGKGTMVTIKFSTKLQEKSDANVQHIDR